MFYENVMHENKNSPSKKNLSRCDKVWSIRRTYIHISGFQNKGTHSIKLIFILLFENKKLTFLISSFYPALPSRRAANKWMFQSSNKPYKSSYNGEKWVMMSHSDFITIPHKSILLFQNIKFCTNVKSYIFLRPHHKCYCHIM